MAVIYAGPKRKKFTIHKDLLISQSGFFKAALCGGFKERETGEVYLPENDPAGLEVLVHKLYRGCLPARFPKVAGVHAFSRPLIEFYVLADKILLPTQAKIEALDKLFDLFAVQLEKWDQDPIHPETISAAWSQTTKRCPMRRLLTDMLSAFTAHRYSTPNDQYNALKRMIEPMDADERLRFMCDREHLVRGLAIQHYRSGIFRSFRIGLSVADSPRYQIGFLKKSEPGTSGAGGKGSDS